MSHRASKFLATPMTIVQIVLVQGAVPAWADSHSCEAECAKDHSAYCLVVPSLSAGPDIPWALRHLFPFAVAKAPGGVIKPVELLSYFGMKQKDDPCNREATIFAGGGLTNKGTSACVITVSGNAILGSSKAVDLGFNVPLQLESSVSVTDSKISFSFDPAKPAITPTFWISDAALNADWGGTVHEVLYTASSVVVSTDNGCIGYNF